jgi:hypothetical protein
MVVTDKDRVQRLLENAQRLLETALQGPHLEEWTIYLDREGCAHLVAGAETPLESVLLTRAASAAWRVVRRGEAVVVEGFDGQARVSLQGRAPCQGRQPLSSRGHYLVEDRP